MKYLFKQKYNQLNSFEKKKNKNNYIRIQKKVITILTVGLLLVVGFVMASLPSKADFQSGSALIYPSYDIKPCTNDTWTIIYTIGRAGNSTEVGIDGGAINITIPMNWSEPQIIDPSKEGFVVVKTQYYSKIMLGEIKVKDRNITIPIYSGSSKGDRIYIIYGEMSGGMGPGAKAQCFPQKSVEFEVWENPLIESNDWRKLSPSPKINVIDHVEGIPGVTNIMTTQAIGVDSIDFGLWPENDDSATAVISEDRFSYKIGLQLNNGDRYGDLNQEIWITLHNYAKTEMVVLLTTDFSITNHDPSDSTYDDIHIWYTADIENKIGQIDPWHYLIKIPATKGTNIGRVTFNMWVDIGNNVKPGYYIFETFIEPTSWDGGQGSFETVNMK